MLFILQVVLFASQICTESIVSSQVDLNSGWFVRSYWMIQDRRQLVWFRTIKAPYYRHPDAGTDWIHLGSKPLLSGSWPTTSVSGIYIDIENFVAVLEFFDATGHQKQAAIVKYVDYLKVHRARAVPVWDYDAKRIWIEGENGSVIQLWPVD